MANKIFEKIYPQGIFQIFDDRPNISNLVELEQVHGSCITNTPACSKADGFILELGSLSEHTPVIKTADCLPILYLGKSHISLVHAGWRGLKAGIHISPELTQKSFEHILIGPSISAQNFEVGPEFRDHFEDQSCFDDSSGKLTFNLQKHAMNQLRECFPLAIIEQTNICTYADKNFNSYRRNKTEIRNWNIFKKKE